MAILLQNEGEVPVLDGLSYVVMAVCIAIFGILLFFVIRLELKVKYLEKTYRNDFENKN